MSKALEKASNLLDVIAGRGSGDNELEPRRQKIRRMSGRRNTWMRAIDPTFREIVEVDSNVKPVIALEHKIFCYRLELLGK